MRTGGKKSSFILFSVKTWRLKCLFFCCFFPWEFFFFSLSETEWEKGLFHSVTHKQKETHTHKVLAISDMIIFPCCFGDTLCDHMRLKCTSGTQNIHVFFQGTFGNLYFLFGFIYEEKINKKIQSVSHIKKEPISSS